MSNTSTPPNGITLVSTIPAPPSTDWVPWLIGGIAFAAAGVLSYAALKRGGLKQNPTITVSLTPAEQAALQRSIEKNQATIQHSVAKGQFTVGGSLVKANPIGRYNISTILWSPWLSQTERRALEKDIRLHGHMRDKRTFDKWNAVKKAAIKRGGVRANPITDLGSSHITHMRGVDGYPDGRTRYIFLHGIYIEAYPDGQFTAWQVGEAGAKSKKLGSASTLTGAMDIAKALGESHEEFRARTRR